MWIRYELQEPKENKIPPVGAESRLISGIGIVLLSPATPRTGGTRRGSTGEENGRLDYPLASPLHALFFARRNKSPTDQPEYFAHADTAIRLNGLWVKDSLEMREVLAGVGVPLLPFRACGSIGGETAMAAFRAGTLHLVRFAPANVIGAEVEVASLAVLGEQLRRARLPVQTFADCAPWAL